MYLQEICAIGAIALSIALVLKGEYQLALTPFMVIISYAFGNVKGRIDIKREMLKLAYKKDKN